MHRNLDRRVEVLCQVADRSAQRVMRNFLDLAFSPDTAAWVMQQDGSWSRSGEVDYQDQLLKRLANRAE